MKSIRLGPLKLESDLLLAPMMDVTTPSYILLCKHYGGLGLYTIPMIFVNQVAAAPKTVRPHLEFIEKNRPSGLQICGSGKEIEPIEKAVQFIDSYDFDFLDINCGCPARHTCNSGGGASLMKDGRIQDVIRLIETTMKNTSKPVSIKIRLGWSSTEHLEEFVRLVNEYDFAWLTVHGRLATQKYRGIVDIDSIRRAVELSQHPVVANGDVYDYYSFDKLKAITGADAVMIGRATMGYPSIFRDIVHRESYRDQVDISELLDQFSDYPAAEFQPNFRQHVEHRNELEDLEKYMLLLLNFLKGLPKYWNNDKFKAIEIKRNMIWAVKYMKHGAWLRRQIGQLRGLQPVVDYITGDKIKRDYENGNPNLQK